MNRDQTAIPDTDVPIESSSCKQKGGVCSCQIFVEFLWYGLFPFPEACYRCEKQGEILVRQLGGTIVDEM